MKLFPVSAWILITSIIEASISPSKPANRPALDPHSRRDAQYFLRTHLPPYVSCTADPVVIVKYGEKSIPVNPDFDNPAKMISEMKIKLLKEFGPDAELSFECAFTEWDTRKFDAMHHIHKCKNKTGLMIMATRTGKVISLKPAEYPTVEEETMLTAFKSGYIDKWIADAMNVPGDRIEWIKLVNPLPEDHPLFVPVPEEDLEQKLMNAVNLMKEVMARITFVASLYQKIIDERLDPVKVLGPKLGNIFQLNISMTAADGALIVRKATNTLLKHYELKSNMYTNFHNINQFHM